MKKSTLLSAATALVLEMGILTPFSAAAQSCIKTPTCAELGFTKAEADCTGKTILKCPLDNSKVYCPSYEETLKTYKVGDIYTDERGIGIGTVVKISDGGTHGVLISQAPYSGTQAEINQYCVSKTTGGLDWGIASLNVMGIYINKFSECIYSMVAEGCYHVCSPSNNSKRDDGYCPGGYCQAAF